ncbi:MAG: hypothetical protein IT371_09255 [Deltaproteobacteria bacterium]|nr:hypothetical protein [Deltaproteobacteria bacterium]
MTAASKAVVALVLAGLLLCSAPAAAKNTATTGSTIPPATTAEPDLDTIYVLFAVGPGVGRFERTNFVAMSPGLGFYQVRWRWFAFTAFGVHVDAAAGGGNLGFVVRLGPEAAFPIYLGCSCLLLGLGLKYELLSGFRHESLGLFPLVPSVSWIHRGPGWRAGLGVKLDFVVPVASTGAAGDGLEGLVSFVVAR